MAATTKNKMDETAILSSITNELEQSLSYSNDAAISATNVDIRTPLDYYLGNPNGTETEGRSQVTSTDVADAIEWILPSVMESFTSSPDVISFDPTHPGDEEQAELETTYVYDMVMKRNNGFVIIHQACKDALLHGNGIYKSYYVEDTSYDTVRYTGLTQEQLLLIQSTQPSLEIVEGAQNDDQTYDVSFKRTTTCKKIHVECVPLENFRINADHHSIDLKDARFVSHEMVKTISELRQEGYPDGILKDLPRTQFNRSAFRNQAQGEFVMQNYSAVDGSMEMVTVNESYTWMDYDGDGIAEYVKVTTVGEGNPTHVLSVEELPDGSPWVGCTAILMSHKFRGVSIYDRVKEVQDQSTAVMRSVLDNFYYQNNQEKEVVEDFVNMDDLLVSLPGGIKRVRKAGSINPIPVQPFTDAPIQLMRYLGEIKAGRVGVSADGASAPQNIGDRVGSEGVEKLMTAKEALAGMMVRVLAETGLKQLYVKVRDLAHRHIDTLEDYRFRDRWVQVNPAEWVPRLSTTVAVGTGSGNKQAKLAAIAQVKEIQAQLGASPFAYLLSDEKIYNTINDFCKFSGLNSAYRYILEPKSEEARMAKQKQAHSQQAQAQQAQQEVAARLQMEASIAQAELTKAQAQRENVQLKAQVEMMKHQRELEAAKFDTQMASMKSQLDQLKMVAEGDFKDKELVFKEKALDQQTFLKLVELNANKEKGVDSGLQQPSVN
jgi:hypothetical protein